MANIDRFEQLRRTAQDRGFRDYCHYREQRDEGQPVWRNNPHQNNHATDEREFWDLGFDNAKEQDEMGLL